MPSIDELSQDLCNRWGKKTAQALDPLNKLISETLSQHDLLAFGFVAEATARLMGYAVQMAKSIQGERGQHDGVLH